MACSVYFQKFLLNTDLWLDNQNSSRMNFKAALQKVFADLYRKVISKHRL